MTEHLYRSDSMVVLPHYILWETLMKEDREGMMCLKKKTEPQYWEYSVYNFSPLML